MVQKTRSTRTDCTCTFRSVGSRSADDIADEMKVGFLTLGGGKVNDVAIILDHVHLLDTGDVVDRELLQRALELLVVGCCRSVNHLLLPSRCALFKR